MKAYIRITDDHGIQFEGDADLSPVSRASAKSSANRGKKTVKRIKVATAQNPNAKLIFTKPERAFIKSYANGRNGQQKFVLLLAYLAKGEIGKEVELKEIQKRWNKMTAPNLLGMKFNRFYPTRAKEHGWVDTSRHSAYVLTDSWKEAITQE